MAGRSSKRRAGGGRKPRGDIRHKTDTFSTRITGQTRAALEREAKQSGQSISQVAERLLMLGLETRKRRGCNKPLRALSFLIEQLALSVRGARWIDPRGLLSDLPPGLDLSRHAAVVNSMLDEWRTDPFRYRAFKIAVSSLLTALEPKGEVRSPFPADLIDEAVAKDETFFDAPAITQLMKNTYQSPENLAAYVVTELLSRLHRSHPLSENEQKVMRHGKWVGEMMLEEFYGMQDARRDLLGPEKNS